LRIQLRDLACIQQCRVPHGGVRQEQRLEARRKLRERHLPGAVPVVARHPSRHGGWRAVRTRGSQRRRGILRRHLTHTPAIKPAVRGAKQRQLGALHGGMAAVQCLAGGATAR